MRVLKILFFVAGAVVLLWLVHRVGGESVASALTRVTWWQFVLVCVLQAANVTVDALAWRYTLPREWASAPLFRLALARCAGDAMNVVTALASIGGEAVKVWLLRREIPYHATIPSLIIAKTSEVIAQALLLLVAILGAWAANAIDAPVLVAMSYLLLVEAVCATGLLLVQIAGVIDRGGRILSRFGVDAAHARQLGGTLRTFYRDDRARFGRSIVLHFVGWTLGAVEALVILASLGLTESIVMALVIEALWSAVRFTTFFVPAGLGTLEGANAVAFDAFGFGAGAGLAFTLVRRARQAVWIGVGAVVLLVMSPGRLMAPRADVVQSVD